MEHTTQPIGGDDPLARLHKMSATAGAAAQDYVAINNLAIGALILSLLGALPLVIGSWALLSIPLAAMVLGLVALKQIAGSNGTQTGRPAALTAVILGVLFPLGHAAMAWSDARADKPDRQRVEQTAARLGQAVVSGDFATAYRLFDPSFQAKVNLSDFTEHWKRMQVSPLGSLQSIQSTGRAQFLEQGGRRFAASKVIMRFEKGEWAERFDIFMVRGDDGQFRIVATALHTPTPQRPSRDPEVLGP